MIKELKQEIDKEMEKQLNNKKRLRKRVTPEQRRKIKLEEYRDKQRFNIAMLVFLLMILAFLIIKLIRS